MSFASARNILKLQFYSNKKVKVELNLIVYLEESYIAVAADILFTIHCIMAMLLHIKSLCCFGKIGLGNKYIYLYLVWTLNVASHKNAHKVYPWAGTITYLEASTYQHLKRGTKLGTSTELAGQLLIKQKYRIYHK